MRGTKRITPGALALVAMAMPVAATAQSQDQAQPAQAEPRTPIWSLPAPTTSPSTPAIVGPVDPKDPTTQPSRAPAPAPTPAPRDVTVTPPPSAVPSARVTPAPGAPVTARPQPEPSATTIARPKAPEAAPSPAPSPSPSAATSQAIVPAASPAAPIDTASEPLAAKPAPPPVSRAEGASVPWWLIAMGALGALALALAFVFLRKRSSGASEPEEVETQPVVAPPPSPAASPRAVRAETPPRPAPSSSTPQSAAPARQNEAHGEITFEPVSLRLSLVYASLRLRFTLRALTEIPHARLHADLVSAHGSASREEQLEPPLSSLPVIGAIPRMAPGQSVVIEHELQLPLGAIRAVREGNAAFFVPLVRLALATGHDHPDYDAQLPHLELGLVFTVGQGAPGQTAPDQPLAPFRVDTGPRDFKPVDTREILAGRRKMLTPLDLPAEVV
ncbi:hypothetical protein HT136_02055 [Novosphingobium profundi]|uniref:hypothetical protein n=1 Tax=Novosphingobium profundi TaxID=1774954 RepID=UPI001BDA6CE5|nr:hypothetical protein [Novosphingobium profundi]MBT0667151.1 hypothetical protein [Novosphingobium profundi]